MASNIYRNKKLLKNAENKQHDIKTLLSKLRKYNPTKPKKIKANEETLSAAEKLLNSRQEVIDAFKTGIFAFHIKEESEEVSEGESEEDLEQELEEESEKELEKEPKEKKFEKIKVDFTNLIEYIENE